MGRKKITSDNSTETVNLENGQTGTKSASWNPQTVAIFCDLCIKEVGKGQRPGTHFNKEGWASLVANFHAETGNNYDKSQLKNKWDLLKKEWKIWKDLIGKDTGLFFFFFPGKYYLVDAGYPQMKGYLGPYKCQRYHLPEFRRGAQPIGYKEVFNHAHSSLRSVIERTFGVWKKIWNILRDMPSYSFGKQVKIVIATMALHNYIRRYSVRDCVFDESENLDIEEIGREDDAQNGHGHVSREMEALRNNIASSLMGAPI